MLPRESRHCFPETCISKSQISGGKRAAMKSSFYFGRLNHKENSNFLYKRRKMSFPRSGRCPGSKGRWALETYAHPMWRSGAAKLLGDERVSPPWLQGSWKIHSAASEPSEQYILLLLPSPRALQMAGKSCSQEYTAVTMPNTQDKRSFSWTLKP